MVFIEIFVLSTILYVKVCSGQRYWFCLQYLFRIFYSKYDPTEINANNEFYTLFLAFTLVISYDYQRYYCQYTI